MSPARQVISHPLDFARRCLRGFFANQGMILAGAVAYYALLSVVPLLILLVVVLSHFVPQPELLAVLARYMEWLAPNTAPAVMQDIAEFLAARTSIGVVLFGTLLFFSAMAFGTVEKAMAVIFAHRHVATPRHPLVSAVLPYSLVALLGLALLALTVLTAGLQALAGRELHLFGTVWHFAWIAGPASYAAGMGGAIVLLTLLYLILPVGRTRLSHALLGGLCAGIAWEAMRHALVWYFAHLSKASVVYGSFSTAVVLLLSMETIALILLLGAQIIAEFERLPCGDEPVSPPPPPVL